MKIGGRLHSWRTEQTRAEIIMCRVNHEVNELCVTRVIVPDQINVCEHKGRLTSQAAVPLDTCRLERAAMVTGSGCSRGVAGLRVSLPMALVCMTP
jgi:hypothetical protein